MSRSYSQRERRGYVPTELENEFPELIEERDSVDPKPGVIGRFEDGNVSFVFATAHIAIWSLAVAIISGIVCGLTFGLLYDYLGIENPIIAIIGVISGVIALLFSFSFVVSVVLSIFLFPMLLVRLSVRGLKYVFSSKERASVRKAREIRRRVKEEKRLEKEAKKDTAQQLKYLKKQRRGRVPTP